MNNQLFDIIKQGISPSRITMIETLRDFKWWRTHKKEATKFMNFGKAFHKLILEHDKFDTDVLVFEPPLQNKKGEYSMQLKGNQEALKLFKINHASRDLILVTKEEREQLEEMYKSVEENFPQVLKMVTDTRTIKEKKLYFYFLFNEAGEFCGFEPRTDNFNEPLEFIAKKDTALYDFSGKALVQIDTIKEGQTLNVIMLTTDALEAINTIPFKCAAISETTCVNVDDIRFAGRKIKGTIIVDALNSKFGFGFELKSTISAKPDKFLKDAYFKRYDLQGALYYDVLNEVFVKAENRLDAFLFLAVENKPSYNCTFFECTDEFLKSGRARYIRRVTGVRNSFVSGFYPSYRYEANNPNGTLALDVPKFISEGKF